MEEAERSYRRSLDAATSCGNAISEVEARVRLAAILADRGQQEEALAVTYEALRLSRACGFALQEVACLLECGRIEQAMGHLEDAAAHFEQAVQVAESHHMGDLLPSALESLSSAKAASGRFDEAYQFLLKSVTSARAWSSSEAARKLAELAAGYRLEKVQHEAEVERIRREALESAIERMRLVARIGRSLTQSLEPRDILMRMWKELSPAIDLTWLGFGVYSQESGIIEFPGLIEAGLMQQASSVFVNDEFSLAALCVREKRVLSYETAADALAAVHTAKLVTFEHAPATVESILYVPLFREEEIIGVLTVQSERPHAYSSDVVELLEAVASFTAIAVENAQIMIRLNELNQTISGEKEQVEREALASSWRADHDSLTGLSNRRVLERILEESIKTAKLAGSRLVVFFVDMDYFKDVNDTWGHDAGDRALVEISRRLVSVVREADLVARVGGDEFVVVAPGLRKEGSIEQMARKLVRAFDQPIVIEEGAIPLSVSVGVAVFPEDGTEGRELISHADQAMYAIKRTGKGAWRMWRGSVEQTL
jgi:diguanylate cyclase (GGDEF)-like protein